MLQEEEFDSEERIKIYSELVKDIYAVSKMYKRKSKKNRNSAIMAPNTKRKRMREKKNVLKNKDDGYMSDSSSAF